MKHDIHTKEYVEKLKSIKLDPTVRVRMWSDLERYADFHTAGENTVRGDKKQSLNNEVGYSLFGSLSGRFLNTMTASLLVILVVIGGGTSLAAEGSIPGDLLYPVKINVNERIESVLALGVDNETKLQVSILEERLREATELAARGKLEGEMATKVESGIEAQTEKTLAVSEGGSVKTQSEVRLALDTTLQDFGTKLAGFGVHLGTDVAVNSDATMGTTLAQADREADTEIGKSMNVYEGEVASETNGAAEDTSMEVDMSTMAVDVNSPMTLTMPMGKLMGVESLVTDLAIRIKAFKSVFEALIGLEAKIENQIKEDVENAEQSLKDAEVTYKKGNEAEARTDLNLGAEYLGRAEAALSLEGELIIDPETGLIVGITMGTMGEGGGQSIFSNGVQEDTN